MKRWKRKGEDCIKKTFFKSHLFFNRAASRYTGEKMDFKGGWGMVEMHNIYPCKIVEQFDLGQQMFGAYCSW